MREKTIEAMRLVLTVTGLVLLFVFGMRAASQAGNMKLAGGSPRHYLAPPSFTAANITQLNPLLSGITTTEALAVPLYNAAHADQPAAEHRATVTPPPAASRTGKDRAAVSAQAVAHTLDNQPFDNASAATVPGLTDIAQRAPAVSEKPSH